MIKSRVESVTADGGYDTDTAFVDAMRSIAESAQSGARSGEWVHSVSAVDYAATIGQVGAIVIYHREG